MDAGKSQSPPNRPHASAPESLSSWKEIAAYLRRDERTVRRWEKEGLPVHRHMHKKRRLEAAEKSAAQHDRRLAWWVLAALLALPVAVLALNIAGVQDRLLGRSASAS